MYQKIKYCVYDADVDVRWLSFENINIKVTFNLYSYKYQMWIPPYFDFYIYNSKVKLRQEFIFMPGVYMYVDGTSEFILSNTAIGSVNLSMSIKPIIRDGLQGVAGMIFLPKFHLLSQHNVAHNIINDGVGDASSPIVYYSVNSFYEYYNQKEAVCDFYGKLSFDDKEDNNHTHKHELGGNINIYNYPSLNSAYNSHKDYISLYGNAIFADLEYGIKNTLFGIGAKKTVSFLAGGFYQIPLISNGICLYDPETNGLSTSNKYTYNKEYSLLESSDSYYYFKFTWPDSQMSHPYGSNSDDAGQVYTDGDSLLGSFEKISRSEFNSSNYTIVHGSKSYINFQGGYLIADSVSGTTATAKLGLAVGGDGTNCDTPYDFTFTTTNAKFGSPRKYWRKS